MSALDITLQPMLQRLDERVLRGSIKALDSEIALLQDCREQMRLALLAKSEQRSNEEGEPCATA